MNHVDTYPLKSIDVCAGTGIGSWAFRRIGLCRTVCYIEKAPYCQQLIMQRIAAGDLDDGCLWDDLTTFDGRPWRGRVDFIFGGIPCQPWSVAGQQRGAADERDLWPAFRRVLVQVRPRFALIENVPGFVAGGGLERLLRDLTRLGYDAEWDVLSAAGVGAHHLRKRVWVVAYRAGERRQSDTRTVPGDDRQARADGGEQSAGCSADVSLPRSRRCDGRADNEGQASAGRDGTAAGGADVADAHGAGWRERERGEQVQSQQPTIERGGAGIPDWAGGDWPQPPPAVERGVRGMADGLPSRVDRLRAIGNAWVPQVAEVVGRRILQRLAEQRETRRRGA